MRRLVIGCSAAALLLTGGLAVSTAVQATTPPTEAPAEVHPFVGAWIYTVDGFPESFTNVLAIDADGKPKRGPRLVPGTDEERARYTQAEQHRRGQLQQRPA